MSSRILPSFVLLALLAACGQKGPLYVPEKPEAQTGNPAAEEQAGGNGDGTDDKEDDGKETQ